MTLSEFVAAHKRSIWDDLIASRDPGVGIFDAALLTEGRTKGKPQIGTAVFTPTTITLEFIYSAGADTTVFPVQIESPERIVFLPVPGWVVETIWQGDISGSFHFESDARRLVDQFLAELEPEPNRRLFERPMPTRRE